MTSGSVGRQPSGWRRTPRPVHAEQELDLDHTDDGIGWLPGLSHRACNLRAGSARGHHLRHGSQRTASRRPDLPVW